MKLLFTVSVKLHNYKIYLYEENPCDEEVKGDGLMTHVLYS